LTWVVVIPTTVTHHRRSPVSEINNRAVSSRGGEPLTVRVEYEISIKYPLLVTEITSPGTAYSKCTW